MRTSWWSPPILQGGAVKIFLASVLSGIWTMWLNREKHCAWTIAERCGCLVVHPTSSFCGINLDNQLLLAVASILLFE